MITFNQIQKNYYYFLKIVLMNSVKVLKIEVGAYLQNLERILKNSYVIFVFNFFKRKCLLTYCHF